MSLFSFMRRQVALVDEKDALPGSDVAVPTSTLHAVLNTPLQGPFPAGLQHAVFGLGCFWGAEKLFWKIPGVFTTAVGYAGGTTKNPTYDEVCSGRTRHTEVVLVVYDDAKVTTAMLVRAFLEGHDPTQGMRQGNDTGTQYRSAYYYHSAKQHEAYVSLQSAYEAELQKAGFGPITTECRPLSEAGPFYYAESYHQQYLHKNPDGYCGLGGTGVTCAVPRDGATLDR
jgi:peptide-methionine (S)-S-oxide reductase